MAVLVVFAPLGSSTSIHALLYARLHHDDDVTKMKGAGWWQIGQFVWTIACVAN